MKVLKWIVIILVILIAAAFIFFKVAQHNTKKHSPKVFFCDIEIPPVAPLVRQDILRATELPKRCTQFIPVGNRLSGSEDCLYLNVDTPEEGTGLPVMVWIHGGSNSSGSAPNLAFFAGDANVVVVLARHAYSHSASVGSR